MNPLFIFLPTEREPSFNFKSGLLEIIKYPVG